MAIFLGFLNKEIKGIKIIIKEIKIWRALGLAEGRYAPEDFLR